MGDRRNIKIIWYTLAFGIFFIPFLLIDLYRIATETTEWEKRGADGKN